MTVRTDFLSKRAAEIVAKSTEPQSEKMLGYVERCLLEGAYRDWQALLKGSGIGLGRLRADSSLSENYFVDGQRAADVLDYFEREGRCWPEPPRHWGRRRADEPESVVVRTVGRGAKYKEAFEAHWLEVSASPAGEPSADIRSIALAGMVANMRLRRERSSVRDPNGQAIPGIELRRQQVFIARQDDQSARPVAAWRIGLRMFFPTGGAASGRLRVPVLNIEVLDSAGQHTQWTSSTRQVFAKCLCRMAQVALRDVGESLNASIDEDWVVDFPFAVVAHLKPDMRDLEQPVHDALAALVPSDPMDHEPLMDSHATLQWIEVAAQAIDPGVVERQRRADADLKAAERQALKELRLPGEEYDLVEFEVRELCAGDDGRLYPLSVHEQVQYHLRKTRETPKATLARYGVDIAALGKIAADYEAIEAALRDRVNESGIDDAEDAEELLELLRTALGIHEAGRTREAPAMVIRVVVDRATGAQVADIAHTRTSMKSFLERATARPKPSQERTAHSEGEVGSYDPGLVTLCVPPKRLKLARTLLEKHSDIARWAKDRGVSIVHRQHGFDAGVSTARVWRSDLKQVAQGGFDDKSPPARTIEAIRDGLTKICWKLNEVADGVRWKVEDSLYTGQTGADTGRFRAWRQKLLENGSAVREQASNE